MANGKTEEFIDLYKQLERLLRENYPDVPASTGPIKWAIENKPHLLHDIDSELDYCREVRNLLQHKPRVDNDYLVTPSDAMLTTLRTTIQKIQNPETAFSACTKLERLTAAAPTDKVRPVLKLMKQNAFTHTPILEDGRVAGVFSENTLLSALMRDELIAIDEDSTFADFADLLPLEAHESEAFAFVSREEPALEVAALFQELPREKRRLGMVFVTADGKPSQKLLGVITAWDVARFL